MNRIHIGLLGNVNDLMNIEICRNGRGSFLGCEFKRSIGTPPTERTWVYVLSRSKRQEKECNIPVLRVSVFVSINCHGSSIQLRRRTHDSHGDFSSIGSHNVCKRRNFTTKFLIWDSGGFFWRSCHLKQHIGCARQGWWNDKGRAPWRHQQQQETSHCKRLHRASVPILYAHGLSGILLQQCRSALQREGMLMDGWWLNALFMSEYSCLKNWICIRQADSSDTLRNKTLGSDLPPTRPLHDAKRPHHRRRPSAALDYHSNRSFYVTVQCQKDEQTSKCSKLSCWAIPGAFFSIRLLGARWNVPPHFSFLLGWERRV